MRIIQIYGLYKTRYTTCDIRKSELSEFIRIILCYKNTLK